MARKALIAALDWGMGHATRCVPLINHYITIGYEVVLASNGTAADFFATYYPQIELRRDLPSYSIQYPASGSMVWAMMRQAPRIMRVIRDENRWLQNNIQEEKWDTVISDNRYGLHHSDAESILVTHQLHIRAPFIARPFLDRQVSIFAAKFDKVWVPDFEGAFNLSGELSHGSTKIAHVEFISPLSRFKDIAEIEKPSEQTDILVMLSGPEPQRSILNDKLVELLNRGNRSAIILGGQPGKKEATTIGNVTLIPHIGDDALAGLIQTSNAIICRSGYSTLMDLHALGRKSLLIPTPGQTDQEYLAEYHSTNHGFVALAQNRLEVATLAERLQTLQLNQG
ncbi:MAG: glycosyltransferase [Flavobacteriales bacterium]